MNQKLKIAFIIIFAAAGTTFLYAQNAVSSNHPVRGQAVLFDNETYTGNITVEHFLQLIGKPIHIKDEQDSIYEAMTFSYYYAERGLFEDEEGKPLIHTDYLSGNFTTKIDTGMLSDMYYRAKAGDTAYIEKVQYVVPAREKGAHPQIFYSKPIKLILTP